MEELEKNMIQFMILARLPSNHVLVVDKGSLKCYPNKPWYYIIRQFYGLSRFVTIDFLKTLLEKHIELFDIELPKKTRPIKRYVELMISAFEKSIHSLSQWCQTMSTDEAFSAEIELFSGRIQDRIDYLKSWAEENK